jgi:5'-3' exonuclease
MKEGIEDLDLEMDSWVEELVTYKERNNLLIVDGLNLAFRWKQRGNNIKPDVFAAKLVSTVNSLAKSYGAREVIFLNDFKSSTYRLGIHPLYKSDRKKVYAKQTQEEVDASAAFFTYYKDVALPLVKKNFTVVQCENVEADDLACYFVEQFEDGKHFDHIWLISTDGDWDELVSERCSRFATTSRKEFTIENFYDNKDCDTPEQFTHVKAVMGDTGDSVYGVPGIGAKRAYNLVRTYGDVFGIIDALPIEGKQLFIQELNNSAELLLLNLELVDLRGFHMEAIAAPKVNHFPFLEKVTQELKDA